MSALIDLLGSKLLSKDGDVKTQDALAGKKAVALYFSAHWCPPCRGFTPQLARWYKDALQAKGLEVVFVSSDRDEEAFNEYFAEQPWLALPFADRKAKAALSKKFKVNGIPSLIILDGATGETITTDGREAVSEDPKGESFPWKPPTIWEALGDEFLKGTDGETVAIDELRGPGKYIGLYFSAHWCPPCRQFTPMLADAYSKHLQAKNLEVIFCSSDKSAAEFASYYATHPWLAIPHGDKRKEQLSKRFGVRGIPTFVVVDGETGEVVSENARGAVSKDPTGANFPWRPAALVDMTEDGPEGINETASLCIMMEACDEAVKAAAKAAAAGVAEMAKAAKKDLLFFYAPAAEGPTEQVRKLTNLGAPSKTPQMVLLDIPDEGGYYVSPATEVTAEAIKGFLEAYESGALERKQLG